VFYEIRPKTGQPARESPLFTLKLYDESEADESQASHELASLKVYSRATNWHDSSDGFKMASAICASGLHLIDSRHLPDLSEDWLQAKLSELAENQQLHTRESRTLNLMQKAIELQSLQEAEEEMMMSSPPLKKPSR